MGVTQPEGDLHLPVLPVGRLPDQLHADTNGFVVFAASAGEQLPGFQILGKRIDIFGHAGVGGFLVPQLGVGPAHGFPGLGIVRIHGEKSLVVFQGLAGTPRLDQPAAHHAVIDRIFRIFPDQVPDNGQSFFGLCNRPVGIGQENLVLVLLRVQFNRFFMVLQALLHIAISEGVTAETRVGIRMVGIDLYRPLKRLRGFLPFAFIPQNKAQRRVR